LSNSSFIYSRTGNAFHSAAKLPERDDIPTKAPRVLILYVPSSIATLTKCSRVSVAVSFSKVARSGVNKRSRFVFQLQVGELRYVRLQEHWIAGSSPNGQRNN